VQKHTSTTSKIPAIVPTTTPAIAPGDNPVLPLTTVLLEPPDMAGSICLTGLVCDSRTRVLVPRGDTCVGAFCARAELAVSDENCG